MVDLVADCIDEGTQEICVTGVSRIQRISEGQMMVAYYRRRNGENLEVMHLIWDRQEWLKMCKIYENNGASIASESFEKPPSEDARKEIH